jgi:hypothetical protein
MALRHESIKTTGDLYVNSRTNAVLKGWTAPVEKEGLKGRNPRRPKVIRPSSAKPGEEDLVSC